ncbi:winged helix-turn-helix transcriptional regulator [Fervidobacterium sp.]
MKLRPEPAALLKRLARAGALEVLASLEEASKRFADLERGLKRTPKVVNMRLKELSALGLVFKLPGGSYALTSRGREVLGLLRRLEVALQNGEPDSSRL